MRLAPLKVRNPRRKPVAPIQETLRFVPRVGNAVPGIAALSNSARRSSRARRDSSRLLRGALSCFCLPLAREQKLGAPAQQYISRGTKSVAAPLHSARQGDRPPSVSRALRVLTGRNLVRGHRFRGAMCAPIRKAFRCCGCRRTLASCPRPARMALTSSPRAPARPSAPR